MKYTSAEANKLLKQLMQDYYAAINIERQSSTFLAATGEDPDSVKPEYDYIKTQETLKELSSKIRKIKHAINAFNTATAVPGFDMTIDEMLVYLPQLNERVDTLNGMSNTLPKVRERTYGQGTNATIDYRYANYDISAAKKEYEELRALLSKAQTALDLLNNSETFEIEL